jgi:hypothetical protein
VSQHRLRLEKLFPAESSYYLTVIPAKAGIHASYWRWIPAFAGMTVREDGVSSTEDDFSG